MLRVLRPDGGRMNLTANTPWAAAYVGGSSDHSLPADVGRRIAEYVASVMPK
jgi:hypothetical protein